MGFLGILEDHKLSHVPATVILSEEQNPIDGTTTGLKRGTGKDAEIILIPQPSDDPNDPLNWSKTRKWVIMAIIGYGSVLYAAVLSPLLSPALVVIAQDFNVEVTDVTVISGYMMLVTGSMGPLVSACARKYGKRPMLLLAAVFGLLGTVVGSAAYSYDGLLAGRILQGGSVSAFESIVISMIGDLFFLHERGGFMTLIQFIVAATSNFSAIIVGPIATNLGWRYLFHMLIPFSALELILLFFFVPETAYNRERRFEIDELTQDNLEDLSAAAEKQFDAAEQLERSSSSPSPQPSQSLPAKKTFIQSLAIFTGTYSDDNLFQLTIAPFAVCLNLAVLWMVLLTGGFFAFFVAQSYVMAQIFSAPPYLLSAAGVGYLSLGPFLGGLLASVLYAVGFDRMTVWCAKKNGGVFEPEYRLLGMIPSVLTVVGLCLFGYLAEQGKTYYLTSFVHGVDLFGIVCAAIASSAYILDAFRDISAEVFIINMVIKNFLFFGFSYFVNDWTARDGPAEVFYVLGGIAAGLICITPVFFYWGKRYRSYWCRNNLLIKLGISTHAEM